MKNNTDGELIKLYLQQKGKSDLAMRELVGRHHEQMYARFLSKVKNESDAHDLQQELWTRVARSLHRYKDEDRFTHYLSKLASNIVIDFYRKTGREKELISDMPSGAVAGDDDDWYLDTVESPGQNAEQQASDSELIQYLSTVLVPQLPVEQRAAWLLRHESEFWDPTKRFEWRHLAELNNMSEEDVFTVFESARHKLMARQDGKREDLDELELLVFLVWTQAQRLDKSAKYTWEYFSQLLGQPVNTMKTRYRTAQKTLDKALNEYMRG